ncbi:MAG TPA: glycosyltransferase family 4 protein [Thermoanaerobaculia bacterium]|nr:glycosyltransferase family 4 protein [Thermoanaerobaculia bacterium]
MKVLFVYKYLTLGGVETVLRARLDGLDRWGIEAHAWFFHDLGGRRVFAGREDRVHVGEVEACLRYAADFDLLATIDTEEIFPGFAAGKRPRLVVECHTPYVENLGYLKALGPLRPAAVLVPSEHQRRVVLERMDGRVPVLVVPNPLREAFVAEPAPFPVPLRRPVVAWIGRLDELKNWKGFIELAGKIDAEIWLAGKPVEAGVAEELLERSREAGILDRLRWYRGLPHDRVPAFLDAVRDSGGVAVSTSNGESFGMTVAEAMARRCAVVAPDRTPFTEFVEDGVNGSLYHPGAAAERVQGLLADAGLRDRLGRKARESILARYAPEPALEALAASLRSL